MESAMLFTAASIIDLAAFALAVEAEQRSTAKIIYDEDNQYCLYYDIESATSMGISAFWFLLASQVLMTEATKCFGCSKASSTHSKKQKMIILIIFWVTFLVAEACLLVGSVVDVYDFEFETILNSGPPSCRTLRKTSLGTGAIFILLTYLVSLLYHLSQRRGNKSLKSNSRWTGDELRLTYWSKQGNDCA